MFDKTQQDGIKDNKNNVVELLKNDFKSFFKLDYASFINIIQEAIPESLYLKVSGVRA